MTNSPKVPHVIPYQGSKRKLAKDILGNISFGVDTFYEPFAGSAAVSVAAAASDVAGSYVISDKLEVLTELWRMIVEKPEALIQEYTHLWQSQLHEPKIYYHQMRKAYNENPTAPVFLYLVARCVKNSVRFNQCGEFNQGPDNRRLGMKPSKLAREVRATAELLRGKVTVRHGDFQDILERATVDDVVYMDPPWQGTSKKTDPRYAYLLEIDKLIEALYALNDRGIPYLLSLDGSCGSRNYGVSLPASLQLEKIALKAGRSSQATLLGRDDETIESLYLSPALLEKQQSYEGETIASEQTPLFEQAV